MARMAIVKLSRPVVLFLAIGLSVQNRLNAADDFEREPISYSATIPQNAVSRLKSDFDLKRAHFDFDPRWGYLRSLLSALNVPESSQMLVFSKTSFQRQRITPKTPRALYFNDEVYVGYCADGDVVEISAVDPALGAVFYTLDQEELDRPRIVRQADTCLLCHANSQTSGVPGFVLRSVFVDSSGYPLLGSSTFETDHTSPLKNRWGGWYVTGTLGRQRHLGNLTSAHNRNPEDVDNSAGLNVTSLAGRFNRSKYLADSSDVVALMVMEHQTRAHNFITAANFATRQVLASSKGARIPNGDFGRVQAAGEQLVKYLLFSGEAGLAEPVRGTVLPTISRPADRVINGAVRSAILISNAAYSNTRAVISYTRPLLMRCPAKSKGTSARVWAKFSREPTKVGSSHTCQRPIAGPSSRS